VRFLIDNQLPAALARWLVGIGVQADHILDLGLAAAPDNVIWARALADQSIVVSKDDDFFLLANQAKATGRLLWVRVGNCRTQALLARFAAAWPSLQAAFASGQQIVELR